VIRCLLLVPLLACLWDTDTIEMEQRRFPDVRELIAGKFTRHSETYYEWRVRDRTAKLAAAPDDLALMDDLAVAYEKLGRRDEAIALARRQLELAPERYETIANLGTFLVHAARYEEGLGFLRRAVAMNPDAHFGRETIQIRLVEYVLSVRAAGRKGLPLVADREARGFAKFLADRVPAERIDDEARAAAVKGVAGMMFFGIHDHPVLLECLAQLLAEDMGMATSGQLGARAYLKASYGVEGAARLAYRDLADRAAGSAVKPGPNHERITLVEVEEQLADELEDGRRFFAAIAADEQRWADAGLDLDAEFKVKYYEVGRPRPLTAPFPWVRFLLGLVGVTPFYLWIYQLMRSRLGRRSPVRPSRRSPLPSAAFFAVFVSTLAAGWILWGALLTAEVMVLAFVGVLAGSVAAAAAHRFEMRQVAPPSA